MGLLDGLLGDSFEDPRTVGLLSLVQSLTSNRRPLQGLSGGLLGYSQAIAAGKQAKQQEELKRLQMEQAQMALAQQKRAQEQQALQDKFRQSIPSPMMAGAQSALAGGGGPTMANAEQMPAVDPNAQLLHGALQAGLIDPVQYLSAQQKQRAKIKEFANVRMPDGSVQIVGLDEYGQPVKTGQTPFKEAVNIDQGGSIGRLDPISNKLIAQFAKTNTPDALLGANVTMRGQNLTDARSREQNAISREAQQSQIVNDPNLGPLIINKGTGLARTALGLNGQPIQGENQFKAGKQANQLTSAIGMARELLPKATASGAGALIDKAGNFLGASSQSADAAAQLETLSGWMVANVPRMEGPQSNIDVLNYQTMAAKVGDRTQPVSQRLAALDTLEGLHRKYASISGRPMSTTGTQPVTGLKFLGFE